MTNHSLNTKLSADANIISNRCSSCGQPLPANAAVTLDVDTRTVHLNGRFVMLTRSHFIIFQELHTRAGRVVSGEQLMDALYWRRVDDEEPSVKVISVLICGLRKRLQPMGIFIQTIRSGGYRLLPPTGVRHDR